MWEEDRVLSVYPWVRKIWRRKWKITPVFLPVESHRQRNSTLLIFKKKIINYLFNMFRFTEKIEWNLMSLVESVLPISATIGSTKLEILSQRRHPVTRRHCKILLNCMPGYLRVLYRDQQMRREAIVLAGVIDDKSRKRHICFFIVEVE